MHHGTVLGDVNKKPVKTVPWYIVNDAIPKPLAQTCLILVAMNLLEEVVEILSNDPEEAIFPLIDFSGIVYNWLDFE